jgi:hypothetical protein
MHWRADFLCGMCCVLVSLWIYSALWNRALMLRLAQLRWRALINDRVLIAIFDGGAAATSRFRRKSVCDTWRDSPQKSTSLVLSWLMSIGCFHREKLRNHSCRLQGLGFRRRPDGVPEM